MGHPNKNIANHRHTLVLGFSKVLKGFTMDLPLFLKIPMDLQYLVLPWFQQDLPQFYHGFASIYTMVSVRFTIVLPGFTMVLPWFTGIYHGSIEYSRMRCICEYSVLFYLFVFFLNGKPMVFLTRAFGNETWKIFYLVNPGDY